MKVSYGFSVYILLTENVSHVALYVTDKLRNQAFREMPKNFSHFLKWVGLIQWGISRDD